MRALGANLNHLRRFLFTEALAISSLSLIIGTGVGILLAWLLVMLLGVLAVLVATGMLVSVGITTRRLSTLKVAYGF